MSKILCTLLLLLLASVSPFTSEAYQDWEFSSQGRPSQEQPLEKDALFTWGKDCSIVREIDLNDWDVDPATGERYYVLKWIHYDCFLSERSAQFSLRLDDRINRLTNVQRQVLKFSIPLFTTRVTEKNLAWTFIPEHVDVKPGSVSNPPSLLIAEGNAVSAGIDTSSSFTPTGGALLIVGWATRAGTSTHSLSDTCTGSGSWTSISHAVGARTITQSRVQLGATPGTCTVTNDYSGTETRKAWVIAEVTGHDTTTPVTESGVGGATTGTSLDITLTGIAAGSLAVGTMGGEGTGAIAPGTNEDELAEAQSAGTGNTRMSFVYGTDNVVGWTWGTTNPNWGIAAEYVQAAAAAAAQVIMID